jgi:hypothetical protein
MNTGDFYSGFCHNPPVRMDSCPNWFIQAGIRADFAGQRGQSYGTLTLITIFFTTAFPGT